MASTAATSFCFLSFFSRRGLKLLSVRRDWGGAHKVRGEAGGGGRGSGRRAETR